MRLKSVH